MFETLTSLDRATDRFLPHDQQYFACDALSIALDRAEFRRLLEYWEERRGTDILPSRAQLTPADLFFCLPCLLLIKVINNGEDFLYQVYGTRVAGDCNRDLTGILTSQIPDMEDFILDQYSFLTKTPYPVYTLHRTPQNMAVKIWEKLILPLGEKDEQNNWRVTHFLVGIYPYSFRHMPDRYL